MNDRSSLHPDEKTFARPVVDLLAVLAVFLGIRFALRGDGALDAIQGYGLAAVAGLQLAKRFIWPRLLPEKPV